MGFTLRQTRETRQKKDNYIWSASRLTDDVYAPMGCVLSSPYVALFLYGFLAEAVAAIELDECVRSTLLDRLD